MRRFDASRADSRMTHTYGEPGVHTHPTDRPRLSEQYVAET